MSPCSWIKTGDIAGTKVKNRYVKLVVRQKRYEAHRVAWFLSTGDWPTLIIDHINGDKQDNRLSNLREVTKSQNGENRRITTVKNKVGYLGVTKVGKKYHAAIRVNGKQKHLGNHPTPEQAHAVYLAAKRLYHSANTL